MEEANGDKDYRCGTAGFEGMITNYSLTTLHTGIRAYIQSQKKKLVSLLTHSILLCY